MAVTARRTYDEIRDEHIRRLGRFSQTNYVARAEEFITAAVFEICTQWHHYELNSQDTTQSTVVGGSEITLPSDLWGIFSVSLRSTGGNNLIDNLNWQQAHALLRRFEESDGQPERWSRFGSKILFERTADTIWQVDIRYYAKPVAPDFAASAASPEIGREWDEIILDYSVALARHALWRPDLAAAIEKRLEDFYDRSPHIQLVDAGLYGPTEDDTMEHPHGGAQG